MSRHCPLVMAIIAALTPTSYAQKQFGFDNSKPSGQPYLTPAESLKRMKVADGFEIKLFAAEPMVTNPIAFTIDERGRVWVVESFEYPKRTPPGQMPRDRIVILEDTKGDGVADKRTVFAEGKDFPERFDMASGIEVGYGGVFLGAAPHLWFIENKNDKPGKFTKLLSGFGSQDTHETLNTFQWGPDGWLYGLHGIFTESAVTASRERERPVDQEKPPVADAPGSPTKLNAGVWRYHPRTHKFEVFAEGTSNPWGWDYRNTDGQMILCCCVIPHLFHIVPGGIYKRQAGTSLNPYAYGYLNEICDHTFHKESGWAHAGLLSLDTPIIPEPYRDSAIFGSIHGNSLKRNVLKRNGSTFTASRADDFLTSGDKNFRPINLRWGPNADIYLSDWHDQNPCHQALPDSWDYEHGRIYRIQKTGTVVKKAEDLGLFTPPELFSLQNDSNPYRYRTAQRLLAERLPKMPSRQALITSVLAGKPTLRNIWASTAFIDEASLGQLANLPDSFLDKMLDHPEVPKKFEADRRVWMFRNWDSLGLVRTEHLERIASWLAYEDSATVRLQIASSCRLYARTLDPSSVLHKLMGFKEDATDPVIPLMLWWAYEPKLAANAKAELAWLQANAAGNPLITDHILPRAMRRLVATGNADDLNGCVAFVAATSDAVRLRALEGLAVALQGRQVDAPAAWTDLQPKLESDPATRSLAQKLAVNFRDPKAGERALAVIHDIRKSSAERAEAARQLGQLKPPTALTVLLSASRQEIDPAVRLESCRALANFDEPNVSREILVWWKKYAPAERAALVNVLAGNKAWARDLLTAVAKGDVAKSDLNTNVVMRMTAFKDGPLNAEIEKVWGKLRDTPADIAKLIDTMRGEVEKAPGSFVKGKAVFDAQCSKCHKFEGRGFSVGPALDGAGRDLDYLLVNILDPNRVVGQPYFLRRVLLKKGTVEEGLLHEEDAQKIALKGENDAVRVIAKSEIESIDVIERSMMPEGLAYAMTTQDFRDLVRYLMLNPPINEWHMIGPYSEKDNVKAPVEPEPNWKQQLLGASGRLPLPNADKESVVYLAATIQSAGEVATRIEFGGVKPTHAWLNGHEVPATGTIDVLNGANKLMVEIRYAGDKKSFSARILDPERRIAP
jgi:putative membrane-bound dehydrogenase-like protein